MPKAFGQPSGRNLLLSSLPEDARGVLEPHLVETQLDRHTLLERPMQAVEALLFPIDCVGSMVAVGKTHRRLEVGLFGYEGMSGTSVVTGADQSPLETFVQVPGAALTIDVDIFRRAMKEHGSLRLHLLRYLYCLMIQTGQTALSNGHAKLEERLARWLLMCHDRVRGDRLNLTHDFLAVMLGVRRAGVTVGTHLLEGKGLIQASRGVIVILDRAGLEDEANGSYGVSEREYNRVSGSAGQAELH